MFNTNESRIGAFAALVALVLVLALTTMAFNALEPERGQSQATGDVSMPNSPPVVVPSFGS